MRQLSLLAMLSVGTFLNPIEGYGQSPYSTSAASTQTPTPASAPSPAQVKYKYPLVPQAGGWVICVQVFKGEKAQPLAEAMAEYIMREHRIPAYLLEGNRKEKLAESARIAELRKKYDEFVREMRSTNETVKIEPFRVHQQRFTDEYAVVVAHPKKVFGDMESARKFLDEVRKYKAPPDEFCTRMQQARPTQDQKGAFIDQAFLNPFLTAFVAPNMTVDRPQQQTDEANTFASLKNLNSEEPYSVLKCRKAYTLVVRMYGAASVATMRDADSSVMGKMGLGRREGDGLQATANQAHTLAKVFRDMKPSYESYVLHTKHYSLVTIGQFDSPDDPELRATKKAMAGLKLNIAPTSQGGGGDAGLLAEPIVMKVPRDPKNP